MDHKISLSDAHAALDKIALGPALPAAPPAGSLLDQATVSARAATAQAMPEPMLGNAYGGLGGLGLGSESAASKGNPNAAISFAETDLLSVVRAKLNRVASEFGIDYALVRDFFTSHL